ncbi:MAG: organomercurial lyase, partial [Stellaceae bacterium]
MRALARGAAIAPTELARALDTSSETVEAFLNDPAVKSVVQWNAEGHIQAFWGLSVTPTPHRLTIKERTLWAWCAQDTLFIPELLGETAEIESRDPETRQSIHLTVSPARIETVEPVATVVIAVRAEGRDLSTVERLMASFCHHIFFFASRQSG